MNRGDYALLELVSAAEEVTARHRDGPVSPADLDRLAVAYDEYAAYDADEKP